MLGKSRHITGVGKGNRTIQDWPLFFVCRLAAFRDASRLLLRASDSHTRRAAQRAQNKQPHRATARGACAKAAPHRAHGQTSNTPTETPSYAVTHLMQSTEAVVTTAASTCRRFSLSMLHAPVRHSARLCHFAVFAHDGTGCGAFTTRSGRGAKASLQSCAPEPSRVSLYACVAFPNHDRVCLPFNARVRLPHGLAFRTVESVRARLLREEMSQRHGVIARAWCR
jgi:hypothetical protein